MALLCAGAAVVIGVGTWQIVGVVTRPANCGSGTFVYQGACVGVTDDASAFDRSLATVVNKIARQNAIVASSGDYVTVALLTPLTTGTDVTLDRVRQEMEGAYAAQESWDSRPPGVQPPRPRIRLLLANEGGDEQAWPQVVQELQQQPASAHLVAVIGVGLSTTTTLRAAHALASGPDPLPMIGTLDTADGLNRLGEPESLVGQALSGPVQNLFRVEPTTGDEVSVLWHYERSLGLSHAMVVYDSNQDDLYTGTLYADFRAQFGQLMAGYAPKEYDSELSGANQFAAIASEICPAGSTAPPPAVLYAGRETLLPTFMYQLRGQTTCHGAVTVITGADAEALPVSETAPNSSGPQVSVVYANLIDTKDDLTPGYKTVFTAAVGARDLDATWAIMTYDAVAAAEQAAQAAVGPSTTFLPPPGEIATYLSNFNQPQHELSGAAGGYMICPSGDEQGKRIPVITDKGGKVTVKQPSWQPSCM